MRPLPAMQRRRAAVASVVGHGAFIALLGLLSTRAELPSVESPLIFAELIPASREPAATSTAPPAEPAAEPAEELAPAPQPAPAPPLATEPNPSEPTPAPRPPTEEPEPELVSPGERTVEPLGEPPPVERLAELPQTNAEPLAESPEAPEPLVAEGLPAAAPANTEEPVRSLAGHEERAVRRRLSS